MNDEKMKTKGVSICGEEDDVGNVLKGIIDLSVPTDMQDFDVVVNGRKYCLVPDSPKGSAAHGGINER